MRSRSVRSQRTPLVAGSTNGSTVVAAGPQIDPSRSSSQFRSSPVIQSGPPLQGASPLPTTTPRLRGKSHRNRQTTARREDEITPYRSPTEIVTPRGSFASGSSSRHKTKKQQEKSRSGNNATPTASPAPSDRHEAERAVVAPAHTPVIPLNSVQTPEREPVVPPVAPPPVASAPSEHQFQAQPQPAQSHVQRPIFNDLSEDERARLHSAHQNAIQHDPNLATSRARYLNARKEFREKLRDALLKADPSVRPILDKMRRQQDDDR
jgi:hypothetical protein